jgi:hypothetical protein
MDMESPPFTQEDSFSGWNEMMITSISNDATAFLVKMCFSNQAYPSGLFERFVNLAFSPASSEGIALMAQQYLREPMAWSSVRRCNTFGSILTNTNKGECDDTGWHTSVHLFHLL